MAVSTMNVSLTDDLRSFVDARVADGSYSSTSEYVRSLIRLDRDRESLKAMLTDGARSPVAATADTGFFASLREIAESHP